MKIPSTTKALVIGAGPAGSTAISADAVIAAAGGYNSGFMEKNRPDRRPLRRMVSRIGWREGFDVPAGYMEMVFDRMMNR